MEPTQNLKNTENALRDFIALILLEKIGEDWISNIGLSEERIKQWHERMEADHFSEDNRPIYYANFFDLKLIIEKQWSIFKEVFEDLKTVQVFLSILEGFRNIDSHRREMLPYQISLIEGICGEIRTRLVKYRSKKEVGEDCFARFESAQDNYGHVITAENRYPDMDTILRPGDPLEFVVTASDPEDAPLEYKILGRTSWQTSNKFSFVVTEADIQKEAHVIILVRSNRSYHADRMSGCDDNVQFHYQILPKK